ncbi:MAG: pyruvate:ferredoxin (flavodoxin) oxidoreductase, partial [Pirellulales bacterium]|nr:pyruvate:ferredoxin (flavodoxin) oxidoreductase [Pirellulales bacterium]
DPATIREFIDEDLVRAHRLRGMNPERPTLRGTAQNPDVFFQAREAANPFYLATPGLVQQEFDRLAAATGRTYRLFDYVGHPEAERVVVMMGSGVGAAEEALELLAGRGERVGLLKVRLYRPYDAAAFVAALPPSVERIAVLDRCKEPGALGEPLYLDVLAALAETWPAGTPLPQVIGGRYGLSSKEFTPAMAASVFAELAAESPKRHFTVGITDDVTHLSLKWDPELSTEADDVTRAVFYGLGSDGTVGANKNSVKIIGENTPLYAQGYFVYDSKKAGSVTVSHVRFSPRPINSSYVIDRAGFVACHQFQFLDRIDMLNVAEPGATFLLNSPYGPTETWDRLPREVQQQIIAKRLKFFVIDALQVAHAAGMGGRINTVMQVCFFALAGVLPRDEAILRIKDAIKKTYGKRGEAILEQNFAAVDAALDGLHEVEIPVEATSSLRMAALAVSNGDDFVERVTSQLLAGLGDLLPVSAMPVDGAFPTSTAKVEKRSIAQEIPIWDGDICIQCGLCALVCPHAAIRMKPFSAAALAGAPAGFESRKYKGKDLPAPADGAELALTIQVAPDDCTGCGVCVDVCPAKNKEIAKRKAINMEPKLPHLDRERTNFDYFLNLPEFDRTAVKIDTVKGSQMLEPLFEFSGACAGCGETPYLKLLSQLFGDRTIIGNATGCSSIYGGNLPTTPWSRNAEGRGPSWNNSLFEDNAEFGLGLRLAADHQRHYAEELLKGLAGQLGDAFVHALLDAPQAAQEDFAKQRERVALLKDRLAKLDADAARRLLPIADALIKRSVWIIGGDGWAYDIGFGGLDHVLTTGRDVNILVLDTGVYSNTGGQASKATPRSAIAKFAAGGKQARKKDLGMLAVQYGNAYVAQIAVGANPAQTVRVFHEAESWPGPSLILAYSHCIAHGINMTTAMTHQKDLVQAGFWPLYRHDPRLAHDGGTPFQLDSRPPTVPFKQVAMQEARFAMLARSNPVEAERLFKLAQDDINDQWNYYQQMAGVSRDVEQQQEPAI